MTGSRGRIFISYRREDTQHVAGRLHDRIEDRFPAADVFMDVDTIEPGVDFAAAIRDAVSSCDVLVALIGAKWLIAGDQDGFRRIDNPDDFVALEIRTALDRGVRVIPVLIDNTAMPRRNELPSALTGLAGRNYARLDHETFRSDVERILTGVERALISAQRPGSAGQPRSSRPATRPEPGDSRSIGPWVHAPAEGVPTPAPVRTVSGGVAESPTTQFARTDARTGRVPFARTALRVGLWWFLPVLILFPTFGLVSTIVSPAGQVGPAVVAVVFLFGVAAGVLLLLRREIRAQRDILASAGVDRDSVAWRPVSSRHVRRVLVGCSAVPVVLGILMGLTPPATNQPNGPAGSVPTSQSP